MEDLRKLKIEIQTDPAGLGYGTWANEADDARIQALIHDATKRPRVGSVVVSATDVVGCFDETEYAALTQVPLFKLLVLLSPQHVDLASSAVRAILAGIFPSNGPTRAALTALWNAQPKTRSRADELPGIGCRVEDVTAARLLA